MKPMGDFNSLLRVANGYFALMLHAHIPYCRKSGVWPAGEEWLFEAMNETYIPLLSVFRNFQRDNIKPRIMMGVVPILAEQLADRYMNERFVEYMEDKIKRAERDIERFKDNPKLKKVAEFWNKTFSENLHAYHQYFYGNLLGTLKWLQEEGVVEVLTSAATHGFLPLMENDSGLKSQIEIGVQTYRKYFGKKPNGFWLPECAYRWREYSNKFKYERRAVDEWLANAGIKYFFIESKGITTAEIISKNDAVQFVQSAKSSINEPTTYLGYRLESDVNVFGRNELTGKQVWSPDYGYPGDYRYREFHLKDPESGLHYHAISPRNTPNKQIYDPDAALDAVNDQADHFVRLIISDLNAKSKIIKGSPPIIVSPYDCELFGHWWLEGPLWIDKVFRKLSDPELLGEQAFIPESDGNNESDDAIYIKSISLSDYIEQYSSGFSTIRMKPSTWGEDSDFTVWNNPEHNWIWPYLNDCRYRFEQLLSGIGHTVVMGFDKNARERRILNQLARELLLMEGSDWPFLLHTKQAKEYANKRFHNHHQRFNKLIWAAQDFNDINRISEHELKEIEEIDNPWADIDLSLFFPTR